MRIQNSKAAAVLQKQLGMNTIRETKSTEKPGSGLRANRASSDVAGALRDVPVVPGKYGSAREFISANKAVFASAGFILSEENGNLIVRPAGGGEPHTLPYRAISAKPIALPVLLGFGGPFANEYASREDIDAEEEDVLWIQSDLIANRLESAANTDNASATKSKIQNDDMAKEMTRIVKEQMLAQATAATHAQANILPQAVLQLLG